MNGLPLVAAAVTGAALVRGARGSRARRLEEYAVVDGKGAYAFYCACDNLPGSPTTRAFYGQGPPVRVHASRVARGYHFTGTFRKGAVDIEVEWVNFTGQLFQKEGPDPDEIEAWALRNHPEMRCRHGQGHVYAVLRKTFRWRPGPGAVFWQLHDAFMSWFGRTFTGEKINKAENRLIAEYAEWVAPRIAGPRYRRKVGSKAAWSQNKLEVAYAALYASRTRFRGTGAGWDRVQDLVEGVKRGRVRETEEAARRLAAHPALAGFGGVVIPAPRSEPGRLSHGALAEDLAARLGVEAAPQALVRARSVPSSRMMRRLGKGGVSPSQHRASIRADLTGIRKNAPILLLDDVATEGNTLLACAQVLRDAGHKGSIRAAVVAFAVPRPDDRDPEQPGIADLRLRWLLAG